MASAAEITPEWITATVGEWEEFQGAVATRCRIRGTQSTPSSQLTFLGVDWENCSGLSPPALLCHKSTTIGQQLELDRERRVYGQLAARSSYAFCPRPFDFSFARDRREYSILLEDPSATHRRVPHEIPPTQTDALKLVDALARFHAEWWDHDRLHELGYLVTDYDLIRFEAFSLSHFDAVRRHLGDRLSKHETAVIERLIARFREPFLERVGSGDVTIVHSDAHVENFLLPRDSRRGSPLLIDWQTPYWRWDVSIGAFDLAYLMIRFWPTRRRRQLEGDLISEYVDALCKYGVRDYGKEQAWHDYRLSAIQCLAIAIDLAFRVSPATWYPQFERTLVAVQDLQCIDRIQCRLSC